MKDTYNTILQPTTEIIYKDRGSKFYGHAFPLNDPDQLNTHLATLRGKYPKAGHHCFAWKIGAGDDNYRTNDDGEPSHSAGNPILGQINSFEVSDVLVVVSRVFGGTKLGIGGLISAYKETAKLVLYSATLVKTVVKGEISIYFEYSQMSQIMRFIDEHQFKIKQQELAISCHIIIAVPLSKQQEVCDALNDMYPINAKLLG